MRISQLLSILTLLITSSGLFASEGLHREASLASTVEADGLHREESLASIIEAEARAEKEAGSRSKWELAAFVLALAALAAFVSGTAIGSRAKHNAEER